MKADPGISKGRGAGGGSNQETKKRKSPEVEAKFNTTVHIFDMSDSFMA